VDRGAVGERGASSTLRRWYTYATEVVSLVVLLFAARELLITIGLRIVAEPPAGTGHVATVVARAIVALAIWLFHVRWVAAGSLVEEDRRSTLRAVAGFGVLGLSVGMTIAQTSRALYYGLARVLGVTAPGGERGDVAALLVTPLATIVVFGLAWAFARRSLVADAASTEAPRQAGVRRLYTHLVALLALAAYTTGLGGLLWALIDLVGDRPQPIDPSSLKDQVSLFLTLIVVGLPMWLAHWRPSPATSERAVLSRRLYLFGALLAGVLTILGSGAFTIQRVLSLVLGAGGVAPWTDIERAASVSLVALAVALYHWRVLRADGEARADQRAPEPTEGLPPLVVELTGASEAEVAAALAGLPASARYTIRRAVAPPLAGPAMA
jgi:hypothetical protein